MNTKMQANTESDFSLLLPPPVSTGELRIARRLNPYNVLSRNEFSQVATNAYLMQLEYPKPDVQMAIVAIESPKNPGFVAPLIAAITMGGVYVEGGLRGTLRWSKQGQVTAVGHDWDWQPRLLAYRAMGTAAWTVLDSRVSRVLPDIDTFAEQDPNSPDEESADANWDDYVNDPVEDDAEE